MGKYVFYSNMKHGNPVQQCTYKAHKSATGKRCA